MTHLGIIGAGQLGAYLCYAAQELGIQTTVLAQHPKETAASVADNLLVGTVGVNDSLQRLIQGCDVVTFEKEDIPAVVLETLRDAEHKGLVRVAPGIDTIRLIQNKAEQKRWLVSHGFPTARFSVFDSALDVNDAQVQLGMPFVLKTQCGGYDGIGVKIVTRLEDTVAFADIPTIGEEYVGDKRELAVLVARNTAGEVTVYPCVEMFFDTRSNVLRKVVSPAQLPVSTAAAATKLGQDIVEALAGVGVFAIELFLREDELLVNEISPRVHNTGHLTIEAQPTSQFEQHLRAICDLPLGKVNQQAAGAMINLLYEPKLATACKNGAGIYQSAHGTYVHWYNKACNRQMRKMGHITATAGNSAIALQSAERCFQALAG